MSYRKAERRQSVREVCNLAATCHPFTKRDCDSFLAIAHDISTDGVGLRAGQVVAVQTLRVELHAPVGAYSVSKLVRVKHVGRNAKARSCLGGIFVKPLSQNELHWLLGKE